MAVVFIGARLVEGGGDPAAIFFHQTIQQGRHCPMGL
jgi:hypothetical protein